MTRIILSGSLVGFILLVAGAPAFAQDARAQQGLKVFTDQKCSLCHSIADKGNKKGPLDNVGAKLKAEEIKQWLVDPATMSENAKATRKPPMKAYGNLGAADLDALVGYLASLKAK